MPWIYKYSNYSLIFRLFTWELDLCTLRRLPLGVSGVESGVGWSETRKSPCSLIWEENEKKEGGGLLLLLGVVGGNWERLDGKHFPEVTGACFSLAYEYFALYLSVAGDLNAEKRKLFGKYLMMMIWGLWRKRLCRWKRENEGGEWRGNGKYQPELHLSRAGPAHSRQRYIK